MKKLFLLTGIIVITLLFSACEKNLIENPLNNPELKSGNADNKGFDQWGYNWNAHQFNGYLINAMFGDNEPGVPWYKKEPPFDGNLTKYENEHPEVLDYPFWIYGKMTIVMHWNESLVSSEGVYQWPRVDTDAWITFHYKMGEGKEKWSQFQKFVAVKSGDELKPILFDESSGEPILYGWFSDKGDFIGYSYLWTDLALVQVVNTGNVPPDMFPAFKSPMGAGLGSYKSR